jgi:hypothetical protein
MHVLLWNNANKAVDLSMAISSSDEANPARWWIHQLPMIAALQRGAAGTASSGGAGGTTEGRSRVCAAGDGRWAWFRGWQAPRPPTVMATLWCGEDGRLSAALRRGGYGRLMAAQLEQIRGRRFGGGMIVTGRKFCGYTVGMSACAC